MQDLVHCRMSALQGKKEVIIGSKVSQSEFDMLQAICDRDDRSMSYVLRELAMRGLAAYLTDGEIRTTISEDKIIQSGRSRFSGTSLKPASLTKDILNGKEQ